MRKLLLLLLLCTGGLMAQVSFPNPVRSGASLPATCSPGGLVPAWFLLTAGGPIATPYYCSAPNTWTSGGGGGGVTSIAAGTGISVNAATGAVTVTNTAPGASPAGSANACQDYLTGSTFGGDATICNLRLTALPDPATLTVVPTCTIAGGETCATEYVYSAQACSLDGCGPGNITTTIENGPDTPNNTNFVTVTPGAVAGSQTCPITRQSGGATQGLIEVNSACGVAVLDKALFADSCCGFGNPAFFGLGASSLVVGNYPIGATSVVAQPVPAFVVSNLYTAPPNGTTIQRVSNLVSRIDNYAADSVFAGTSYATENIYNVSGTHNYAGGFTSNYTTTVVSATGNVRTIWGTDIETDNLGATVTGDQRSIFALARTEGGVNPDMMAVNGTLNLGGGTITNAEAFKAQREGGTVPSGQLVAYYVDNSFGAVANEWSFLSDSTAAIGLPITAFSALVAYASHAEVYCSDCTVTSGINNTCAGSGSGANAVRVNGAWKCWQ